MDPGPSASSIIPPDAGLARSDVLRILGSRIDRITFREALERIGALAAGHGNHQIVTGNTLMLLAAEKSSELRAALEEATLVIPESSGIAWASRRLKHPLSEFIPGIDLLTSLCHLARDRKLSVYLLGARPGVAETAARTLTSLFPGLSIAGTHDGYFSETEATAVCLDVRRARPAFVFVGMSVPGQEIWIYRHRQALGAPVIMGVGGSFDVLSGQLRRAPGWMRRLGIEWVYRLAQEPWRWRRIAQLPVFAWKVIRESRLQSKKTD